MVPSSQMSFQRIWETTLKDAAGFLAAYITPENFDLKNTYVMNLGGTGDDDFRREINARLDLGRTAAFLELLGDLDRAATSSFRHEISYSERLVRGKLHVPRWIGERARGLGRRIPAIRAERQLVTPENLLISEATFVCAQIARVWKDQGGAEGAMAQQALQQLLMFEAHEPWNELRSKPRERLNALVEFVRGRLKTAVIRSGGVIERIVNLFSARPGNVAAFEAASGPLSLLVAGDPLFEDRLFELVCLGWIVAGLKSHLNDAQVFPRALKGAQKGPLLSGHVKGVDVRVFFQRGGDLLPSGRWIYKHSGQSLRAIPDIVVETVRRDTKARQLLLIDAKNRSVSSEGDVLYKLIGYQENLGLVPYLGVGLYPKFSTGLRTRVLKRDATRTATVVHVPLDNGRRVIKRMCDVLVAKL
jgi:hypothetical protein